jgi:hypothetical protein
MALKQKVPNRTRCFASHIRFQPDELLAAIIYFSDQRHAVTHGEREDQSSLIQRDFLQRRLFY